MVPDKQQKVEIHIMKGVIVPDRENKCFHDSELTYTASLQGFSTIYAIFPFEEYRVSL